jgi:hypothetical protein
MHLIVTKTLFEKKSCCDTVVIMTLYAFAQDWLGKIQRCFKMLQDASRCFSKNCNFNNRYLNKMAYTNARIIAMYEHTITVTYREMMIPINT